MIQPVLIKNFNGLFDGPTGINSIHLCDKSKEHDLKFLIEDYMLGHFRIKHLPNQSMLLQEILELGNLLFLQFIQMPKKLSSNLYSQEMLMLILNSIDIIPISQQ